MRGYLNNEVRKTGRINKKIMKKQKRIVRKGK
jgi:hypothetical protein